MMIVSWIPSHRKVNGFPGSFLRIRDCGRKMKYDAIWMIVGEMLLRIKALVKRPIS